MLRSVFTVGLGRLAVAFEGGHVVEVGDTDSSGGTYRVHHMQRTRSGSNNTTTSDRSADGEAPALNLKGAADKSKGVVAGLKGETTTGAEAVSTTAEGSAAVTDSGATAVDIAYSTDARMIAIATENKHVRVWRSGVSPRKMDSPGTRAVVDNDGDASMTAEKIDAKEAEAQEEAGVMLGEREIPKKPTSILFAPVTSAAGSGDVNGRSKEYPEVIVISDKCGDAYAAPLPDPSTALKHLLGHTAMTITAMAPLKEGTLLATADRAEHIRVSQFPRTTIVHTYLLGHKDFVSALAAVPGNGGAFLLSGGGDGMVGLWDAEAGKKLAMISVRQACQDLADGDAASEGVAAVDLEEADADADADAGDAEGGGEGGGTNGAFAGDGEGGQQEEGEGAENGNCAAAAAAAAAEQGSGAAGDKTAGAGEKGRGSGDSGGGGGGGTGSDGGVPLSVSCSEDGKIVAVVVSGLDGLLLLNLNLTLSRGGGGGGGDQAGRQEATATTASLTPRARLQLPSVPIQAGFLDGDLIVALPSSTSADCMQAFTVGGGSEEGATPATSGSARDKCWSINAWARDQAHGERKVLKAAVPDDDASEALGGGLRKHKGTRNAGKDPYGWNNFSKRKDKKVDKKRKRQAPRTPTEPAAPVAVPSAGGVDGAD